MQTVKSSYGPKPHLVTPSSRNRYLLTCPCEMCSMFDLFHHVLTARADIGIVMEYLMEAVKKFEPKKTKTTTTTKKTIIIFDYKRIQVNPDSKSTGKKEERNYLQLFCF